MHQGWQLMGRPWPAAPTTITPPGLTLTLSLPLPRRWRGAPGALLHLSLICVPAAAFSGPAPGEGPPQAAARLRGWLRMAPRRRGLGPWLKAVRARVGPECRAALAAAVRHRGRLLPLWRELAAGVPPRLPRLSPLRPPLRGRGGRPCGNS